ncbi:MAG: YbgC/FadM family acyl-CoA thioesterase [Alphaproteobacteria bacterium]|nr:YbgC/FadM family acyl-CoA thioesterase [Alphaproteobacteria bacterium]
MKHDFSLRVYYDHTDTGGVVYHSHYMIFAEHARTEFLRDFGINQQELFERTHCLFVVTRVQINYKASAKLDDLLVVETTVTKIQNAQVSFKQIIKRDGKEVVVLLVDVAFIAQSGKLMRLPAEFLEKLKERGN